MKIAHPEKHEELLSLAETDNEPPEIEEATEEEENAENIRSGYSKRSLVWKYFDQEEGTKKVSCKHCDTVYAHTSATTQFFRHMQTKHPKIYKQIKIERAEMKERQMEIDEEYNRTTTLSFEPQGKGSKIWTHFRKDGPTKITCIACGSSFSVAGGSTSSALRHLRRVHPELDEKENEEANSLNEILIWQFFEQMEDENAAVCMDCQLPIFMKSADDTAPLVDHLKNSHTQSYESFAELQEQSGKKRITLFRHSLVKKRAAIWNYFDRTDDPMIHSCKACSMTLSGKAKYSANLVKHLKVTHQKLYIQYQKDCGLGEEQIQENLTKKLKKRGPKPKYEPTDETHKTCPVCLKLFSSRKNMLAHERAVHSGAKPFVCDECGMTFARKESLTRHSHSTDRPFLCTYCGKTFAKKHIRDIHERAHFEEKRFNCDFCNKKFSSNQKKKIHERIHTGDRPYQCEVCSKRFVQNHQLQTHMRIHTGDKPHACEFCNQTFRHLSTKAKHNCPAKPTVIQQAMIIEEPVVQVQQVQVQTVQAVEGVQTVVQTVQVQQHPTQQ